MVMVVILTVAPIPIALLLIFGKMVVVPMGVDVVFGDPLVVVDVLLWSPGVIVAVIGIVGSIVVMSATGARQQQKASKKQSAKKSQAATHRESSSIRVQSRYWLRKRAVKLHVQAHCEGAGWQSFAPAGTLVAAELRSVGGGRHEFAYIAERLLIGFASKRRAWTRHRNANSEKDGLLCLKH